MEKRIISLLLTLVMVFSVLASVDLSAYAVDSGKSAHTDYSNLTPNQYLAMIFTNHNYNGTLNEYGANNDYPPYNIMQNYYMDANKASRARIIFNEFNAATDYKTTRGLYELLSFSGGSAVEKVMELEDYYTAILLSIVDVQMSQKNFVDDLNCKTNKTILTLSSNISKYLESTSKFENTDFMNTLRTEDLSDADFQAVLNICAADMDAQELFNLVGKDIGIIKKILSVGDTINESVKNIADFAQLANLNTATKETLHQIYINCPDDNLPMKNAARKVYEYTSGQMSYEIMSMSNAGYTACKYAMSEIVGELWKSCLTAVCGEMAVGVLIGQAVGKLISNYCFATDAVDEQLCAISALVDFEDVMVAAVHSLEDTYKSNSNVENSENYVTSLRMLMSTYDLGCEYVEDFVDTVYTKGFINNVQFNNGEEYNTWKTVIADQKVTNEKRRELLYLPYYKNVYAIDAPSAYTAYFIGTDFQYKVLSELEKTCEITGYTGSETMLNIPSVIDGYTVLKIGDLAFHFKSNIVKVIIPDSVRTIGSAAFFFCTDLESIEIPSSVTNIGTAAFSACTALQYVNVQKSNLIYISENGILFNRDKTKILCYPGGKAEDSYIIPSSVKEIDDCAFLGCRLQRIDIPNEVKHIGEQAFEFCAMLANVKLPNTITEIGYMTFAGCSSLKEIKIPNSVLKIGDGAFFWCESLESIQLPNSVLEVGSCAFSYCGLKSVTIGKRVQRIGDAAFYSCPTLTSITIPNSVLKIGHAAFGYMDSESGQEFVIEISGQKESIVADQIPNFTIYGYDNSLAKVYSIENDFAFTPLQLLTDTATGISVAETNVNDLPARAVLQTEQLGKSKNEITYDITLTANGSPIQPTAPVTVKIPVPATMDGSKCKVYRQEADGTYTDMQAVYQDGYMVFTTDHFSIYVLTVKDPNAPAITMGDINGDGVINAVDARWALQSASGVRTLSDEQLAAADVNGDGVINAVDARWILQAASGVRVL